MLQQEELLWFKRSREEWIKSGDRNTKFYHSSTLIRKSRNKIGTLKNNVGDWISDALALENMVLTFYKKLFEEGPGNQHAPIPRGFPNISMDQVQFLRKPFFREEIKKALFDMAPFKAPGMDGIHAGFYQKTREIVGDSLCNFALDFLDSGILPAGSNDTLLVFIPKIEHPEQTAHLRPISLCNVCYKVITKILTNILKEIMGSLIAPN